MSETGTSQLQRNYRAGDAGICGYCQGPLDPLFYFCRRCATPYKPAITIVGHAQPAPLTDADRVRLLAPATWTVFWTFAAVVIAAALVSVPFVTRDNLGIFYFIST